MTWNYPHFTPEEMACKCGCSGLPLPVFMEFLEAVRDECDFVFRITSGYRCPDYNAQVSDTGLNGPHTTGLAADVGIFGPDALVLVKWAIAKGVTGLGISQKGPLTKRFVHLDIIKEGVLPPRPRIWSY